MTMISFAGSTESGDHYHFVADVDSGTLAEVVNRHVSGDLAYLSTYDIIVIDPNKVGFRDIAREVELEKQLELIIAGAQGDDEEE